MPAGQRYEPRERAVQGSFQLAVALGCAFAALLLAVVLAVRIANAGKVLPGTRMVGVALGGSSEREAERRIAAIARSRPAAVTLTRGSRPFVVQPRDAGYSIDVAASANRAMRAGREGFFGGAWSTLAGLIGGRDVAPAARIDEARLRRTVRRVGDRIDVRPTVGRLSIASHSLQARPTGRRDGELVDRRRLERLLRDALLDGKPATVEVPIRHFPTVSQARLESLARAATAFLRQPLRLVGTERRASIAPRQLATVLALQPVRGGRDARLGADLRRLRALVAGIAKRVDEPARDARVSAPAVLAVFDRKGDASWRPRRAPTRAVPARRGLRLLRDELASGIAAAIRAGRHSVTLPMRRVEPTITTPMARRVRWLIGTFTTRYEPGQPRVTNIKRIARSIDGTAVPPGAEFSLNRTAGPRTREKGYVEAPFIADDRIVPSVGGGVSQVATTLYNAAYFAGLRVDAHQPHSLFIDRYPAGREATLNYPDIDVVWTNDTTAPVLIRAAADADSVTVSLYGNNGGREVLAEAGRREPVPGGDFAITVVRVVRYADGRVARQPYTTSYRSEVREE